MTRKHIISLASGCGLLLGGCMHLSTTGMRQEPVLVDRTTTKGVGEIVGCLDTAWSRQGSVKFVPNGHGGNVSVSVTGPFTSPILFLVDIDDLGTSRRIEFRMLKSVWKKAYARERKVVEACA